MIPGCFGFALLPSLIGQENLRHPFNQSNAGWKPVAVSLLSFSRAVRGEYLNVFAWSSQSLLVSFSFGIVCSPSLFFLWFHVTE